MPLAHWAVPYLQAYLAQRKTQYYESGLFNVPQKPPKRISATHINNIVKKYTTAFGRPSTTHKMRHTTASELFQDCKNEVLVSQQLGQKGTSDTALYTHVTQDELQRIINHIK